MRGLNLTFYLLLFFDWLKNTTYLFRFRVLNAKLLFAFLYSVHKPGWERCNCIQAEDKRYEVYLSAEFWANSVQRIINWNQPFRVFQQITKVSKCYFYAFTSHLYVSCGNRSKLFFWREREMRDMLMFLVWNLYFC